MSLNVFGTPLQPCSFSPMTGFFRNGYCETGVTDTGTHTVCAQVSRDFLTFTKSMGNDLEQARPQFSFPGLKPGDNWCLCAMRWKEALKAGKAPKVVLTATHVKTLDYIDDQSLQSMSHSSALINK